MKALLLALLPTLPAAAYWQTDTTLMQAPRIILVNKSGKEQFWYQASLREPARFTIESRQAVRWTVNADSEGVVSIYHSQGRNDSALIVQKISRGINDVRLFCEPDDYKFCSSVPTRIHFYRWQAPNIIPMSPVGGGIPVPLLTKDNSSVPYYYVSHDTTATMRIKGPATAYIYVRPYAPVTGKYASLEFEVREGNAMITHRVITPTHSGEVAFTTPIIGYAPGKPALVRLKVPAGLHVYTLRPINDRAMVKFFSKTTVVKTKVRHPLAVAKPRPAPAPAPEPPPPIRRREPVADPVRELVATASTGFLYNDNIYSYGDVNYDNYTQAPERAYRYPGVHSLDDMIVPVDLKVSYKAGPFRARGGVGARKYWHNGQLDNANYSVALGWRGPDQEVRVETQREEEATAAADSGILAEPVRIVPDSPLQGRLAAEIGYASLPYKPIRPSFSTLAGRYALLSYGYHRGDFRMQLENRWNPEMRFSAGMYDYGSPFDHLDAVFLEGGFGFRRERTIGLTQAIDWSASIGFGDVLAIKAAAYNWSNAFFSINAGISYDMRNWTFGMRTKVQPRFFSAGSDLDPNKGRKDLESDFTPLVQYHFRAMTVSANLFEMAGRKTWAADPDDEQAKSYFTLGGGLNLSSSFSPLGWLDPERS